MGEKALQRGDIVLIIFPFTDLTTNKVRPAVLLSLEPQSDDVVVAFISSVSEGKTLTDSDYLCRQSHPDFAQTGLKKSSVFRMKKVATLHRNLILRRLGKVSANLQRELDIKLKKALGLE